MKSRVIAIGDVHGCAKTFNRLLHDELGIQKTDDIYCLGDLIDRGPESKTVIDTILKLRSEGHRIFTLRGNHEQLMMDSVRGEEQADLWRRNGGETTLQSFNASSYMDIDTVYRQFFENTEFFIAAGEFIFVHAGLNFQRTDPFEDTAAMLWIRDFHIDRTKLRDRVVVHGHTPRPLDFILNQELHGAINIDGGCVYKQHPGLGNLVALNLSEGSFAFAKNLD